MTPDEEPRHYSLDSGSGPMPKDWNGDMPEHLPQPEQRVSEARVSANGGKGRIEELEELVTKVRCVAWRRDLLPGPKLSAIRQLLPLDGKNSAEQAMAELPPHRPGRIATHYGDPSDWKLGQALPVESGERRAAAENAAIQTDWRKPLTNEQYHARMATPEGKLAQEYAELWRNGVLNKTLPEYFLAFHDATLRRKETK